MTSTELLGKAKRVKLLALDCDGVLTDGGVYVFEDGREFRRFSIKDGLGLRRLQDAGIVVAIISSSKNTAVEHRAKSLGITEVFSGVQNKLSVIYSLIEKYQIEISQVAYMGDDLVDLLVLSEVGLSFAPADAAEKLREVVDFVTQFAGGNGAVREVCELVLLSVQEK